MDNTNTQLTEEQKNFYRGLVSTASGLDLDTNVKHLEKGKYTYALNGVFSNDNRGVLESEKQYLEYPFNGINENCTVLGYKKIDFKSIVFLYLDENGISTVGLYYIQTRQLEWQIKDIRFGFKVTSKITIETATKRGGERNIYWVDDTNPVRTLNFDDLNQYYNIQTGSGNDINKIFLNKVKDIYKEKHKKPLLELPVGDSNTPNSSLRIDKANYDYEFKIGRTRHFLLCEDLTDIETSYIETGQLYYGGYSFCVQFIDTRGNGTNFVAFTKKINIYDKAGENIYDNVSLLGGGRLAICGKGIRVKVVTSKDSPYSLCRVGILASNSGSGIPRALLSDYITVNEDTGNKVYEFNYVTDAGLQRVDESVFYNTNTDIENAKTLCKYEGRLLLGNTTSVSYDFCKLTENFYAEKGSIFSNKDYLKYSTVASTLINKGSSALIPLAHFEVIPDKNVKPDVKNDFMSEGEYYKGFDAGEIISLGITFVLDTGIETPVLHLPGNENDIGNFVKFDDKIYGMLENNSNLFNKFHDKKVRHIRLSKPGSVLFNGITKKQIETLEEAVNTGRSEKSKIIGINFYRQTYNDPNYNLGEGYFYRFHHNCSLKIDPNKEGTDLRVSTPDPKLIACRLPVADFKELTLIKNGEYTINKGYPLNKRISNSLIKYTEVKGMFIEDVQEGTTYDPKIHDSDSKDDDGFDLYSGYSESNINSIERTVGKTYKLKFKKKLRPGERYLDSTGGVKAINYSMTENVYIFSNDGATITEDFVGNISLDTPNTSLLKDFQKLPYKKLNDKVQKIVIDNNNKTYFGGINKAYLFDDTKYPAVCKFETHIPLTVVPANNRPVIEADFLDGVLGLFTGVAKVATGIVTKSPTAIVDGTRDLISGGFSIYNEAKDEEDRKEAAAALSKMFEEKDDVLKKAKERCDELMGITTETDRNGKTKRVFRPKSGFSLEQLFGNKLSSTVVIGLNPTQLANLSKNVAGISMGSNDDDVIPMFSLLTTVTYLWLPFNLRLRLDNQTDTSGFLYPTNNTFTHNILKKRFMEKDNSRKAGWRLSLGKFSIRREINFDYLMESGTQLKYTIPYEQSCSTDNKGKYPTRVVYSDLQVADSLVDSYKVFRKNNYRDYPAEDGSITNMFVIDNKLHIHMEDGLYYQPRNTQAHTVGEITVYTGTGGFLSTEPNRVIDSDLGFKGGFTSDKDAFIKVDNAVYFVSETDKRLYGYTTKGLVDLTDIGVTSLFNDYFTISSNKRAKSIVLGYDPNNKRLLVTAYWGEVTFKRPETGLNDKFLQPGLEINDGLYPAYNDSKENAKNKENITVQANGFTVSFSLLKKVWASLHSCIPSLYINTDKTLLCNYKPSILIDRINNNLDKDPVRDSRDEIYYDGDGNPLKIKPIKDLTNLSPILLIATTDSELEPIRVPVDQVTKLEGEEVDAVSNIDFFVKKVLPNEKYNVIGTKLYIPFIIEYVVNKNTVEEWNTVKVKTNSYIYNVNNREFVEDNKSTFTHIMAYNDRQNTNELTIRVKGKADTETIDMNDQINDDIKTINVDKSIQGITFNKLLDNISNFNSAMFNNPKQLLDDNLLFIGKTLNEEAFENKDFKDKGVLTSDFMKVRLIRRTNASNDNVKLIVDFALNKTNKTIID